MRTKELRTVVAAAMGGAVLLAGLLVGASIALAEDEPATTVEEKSTEESRSHFLDGCGEWVREFRVSLDAVAEELGFTLDEIRERIREGATLEELAEEAGIDLDEALQAVKDKLFEVLDERVSDGVLTEDEASAIKERIEAFELGEFPLGARGRHHGGPGGVPGFGLFGDLDLGIDLSELRESLESGMNLDEALDDLGVDLDAALEDARESALSHIDELVEDGVISEERADDLRAMIEGFEFGDGFPFPGRGFRFDFGDRGRHHGFDFFGDGDGAAEINAENTMLNA